VSRRRNFSNWAYWRLRHEAAGVDGIDLHIGPTRGIDERAHFRQVAAFSQAPAGGEIAREQNAGMARMSEVRGKDAANRRRKRTRSLGQRHLAASGEVAFAVANEQMKNGNLPSCNIRQVRVAVDVPVSGGQAVRILGGS